MAMAPIWIAIALILALMVESRIRGRGFYRELEEPLRLAS
jgi:ABC-type sugar transport system permease subunit